MVVAIEAYDWLPSLAVSKDASPLSHPRSGHTFRRTPQTTRKSALSELQRDPDEWKTGDEPLTAAQRSYLETLCRETSEEFDDAYEGRGIEAHRSFAERVHGCRSTSPRTAYDEA